MRLGRAFLVISFFSYVCLLLLVSSNVAVLIDPTDNENSVYVGFFLAGILLYSMQDNKLNIIWGGVYGSMALLSFLGIINWVDYVAAGNINMYMCIWDLLIGVSLVYESKLYIE